MALNENRAPLQGARLEKVVADISSRHGLDSVAARELQLFANRLALAVDQFRHRQMRRREGVAARSIKEHHHAL